MGQEFTKGLLIAAIGMGLVFAVIIFLWGVMALMMRLTSREKKVKIVSSMGAPTQDARVMTGKPLDKKYKAAAAAVAVAISLAREKTHARLGVEQEASGSFNPWQTAHRLRQIENKRRRG